jgi:hypothetical protein
LRRSGFPASMGESAEPSGPAQTVFEGKGAFLRLAQSLDDTKKEQDGIERQLSRIKIEYDTNKTNLLAKLARTREKLAEISKSLMVEARTFTASYTPTPERAPVEGAPRVKGPNMSGDELTRRLGPKIWTDPASHIAIRRNLIQFVYNRPASTSSEIRQWIVEQGVKSGSAATMALGLRHYLEGKGWTTDTVMAPDKAGRKVEHWRVTKPAKATLDLATATADDRARMIAQVSNGGPS